jgi:hypothetical protein
MEQSFVARTHQVRSALLCGTNGVWHRCFVGELERPHTASSGYSRPTAKSLVCKTAWWGWEDSYFQPNDYQLLASEVSEVARLCVRASCLCK